MTDDLVLSQGHLEVEETEHKILYLTLCPHNELLMQE